MAVPKKGTTNAKAALGVFLVDDEEIYHCGIKEVVNGAPEKDMVFLAHSGFDGDLLDKIDRHKPDVVLVDIANEGRIEMPVGLRVIRTIRQQFGSALGIVGYSVYKEFRDLAIERGADRFEGKGATNDRLRQVIRACKDHDVISKLEIVLDVSEVRVTVSGNGVDKWVKTASLQRDNFCFLSYLAEERAANKMDWIGRRGSAENGFEYLFNNMQLWHSIRKQWDTYHHTPDSKSQLTSAHVNLAQRSTEINKTIQQTLGLSGVSSLIVTPGPGRKHVAEHTYAGTYFLNPFIHSRCVDILDGRVRQAHGK